MTSKSANMQEKLEEEKFYERFVFSDEAIFHTNGKVNRHEHKMNSPKVNLFCAISKNHVLDWLLSERDVTGDVYLQVL